MISHAMNYPDHLAQELAHFQADLPILTRDKIEQRCRRLSVSLTAAVRSGEITTEQLRRAAAAPLLRAAPRGGPMNPLSPSTPISGMN